MVLQQPFPNLGNVIVGLVCVYVGLGLFVQGLESGLFPLGEVLARGFANKGSLTAILAFAFCLGFGATIAEPALIAVAAEAAEVASETGAISDNDGARSSYVLELRLVVATSVGLAIVLGVIRILKGWPIHHLIIGGYVLVTVMTLFAPAGDHRCGLRFRGRDHQHDHRSAGYGAGCGARHVDPWAQSHGGRFRADRLRQPDAHDLCNGLRHGYLMIDFLHTLPPAILSTVFDVASHRGRPDAVTRSSSCVAGSPTCAGPLAGLVVRPAGARPVPGRS